MAFHKPLRLQQGASDLKNSQGLRFQDINFSGSSYWRIWAGSTDPGKIYYMPAGYFLLINKNGATASSTDGINWTTINGVDNLLTYGDSADRYSPLYLAYDFANRIGTFGNYGSIMSRDGGFQWIQGRPGEPAPVGNILYQPYSYWSASLNGGRWISTDGGGNFRISDNADAAGWNAQINIVEDKLPSYATVYDYEGYRSIRFEAQGNIVHVRSGRFGGQAHVVTFPGNNVTTTADATVAISRTPFTMETANQIDRAPSCKNTTTNDLVFINDQLISYFLYDADNIAQTFISTQDGLQWKQHCLSTDIYAIAGKPGGRTVAAGNEGLLWSSAESDAVSWKYESGFQGLQLSKFGAAWNATKVAATGNKIIVMREFGSMVNSADAGATWAASKSTAGPLLAGTSYASFSASNIYHDGTRFWNFGEYHRLWASNDGETWPANANPFDYYNSPNSTGDLNGGQWNNEAINAMSHNGTTHIIVGNGGRTGYAEGGFWVTNNHAALRNSGWGLENANCATWTGSRYVIGGNDASIAWSPDGKSWNNITTLRNIWGNSDNRVRGIAGTGNIIVAVGGGGATPINKLAYSNDGGANWQDVNNLAAIVADLNQFTSGVTYANGIFIVGGRYGKVITSGDGSNWTVQNGLQSTNFGNRAYIYGVTWSGSYFVVVGELGRIATSPDGVTWTDRSDHPVVRGYGWGVSRGQYAREQATVHQILYTPSIDEFIAVGDLGRVATSNNGINWTYRGAVTAKFEYMRSAFTEDALFCVAYGNGVYVAGGRNGGVIRSTDRGVTWEATDCRTVMGITTFDSNSAITGIVWDGSKFVALTSDTRIMATSANGRDWTLIGSEIPAASPTTGWYLSSGASGFSGVADLGISNYKMIYANGRYVVVGRASQGQPARHVINLATSTVAPGTAWEQLAQTDPNSLYLALKTNEVDVNFVQDFGLAYGAGLFVVVCSIGSIATSTDGLNWTNRAPVGFFKFATSVSWTGSKFVAGARGGRIATSPDGINWTYNTQLIDVFSYEQSAWRFRGLRINDICWTGSQYIAVGERGRVATSPDGIAWTDRTSLRNLPQWSPYTSQSNGSIQYCSALRVSGNSANSVHSIIGSNGRAAYSTDGQTWFYTDTLRQTYWGQKTCHVILWNEKTVSSALFDNTGSSILIAGSRGKVATQIVGNLKGNVPGGETWFKSGVGGSAYTFQSGKYYGAKDALLYGPWGDTSDVLCGLWDGTKFIIAGEDGKVATSFVDTSSDVENQPSTTPEGISWNFQAGLRSTGWGTGAVRGIVRRTDGLISVVGDGGRVATSTNGVAWNYHGVSTGVTYRGVTHGNGTFVAAGDNSVVATSPDGTSWTLQQASLLGAWGGSYSVRAIAYNTSNNNTFVVVGDGGRVATSLNGVTWTNRTLPAAWGTANVLCILWNGTNFIIGGERGNMAISQDGINWTFSDGFHKRYSATGKDVDITAIGFINNRIVVGTTAHKGFLPDAIVASSVY